ncbi:MAG: hypothetical protein Q6361_02595 [Candidatus Hermodarchaeota archaeon]|nr:hypothetical protein [Candidatus Hermodarchaeota archaeon]
MSRKREVETKVIFQMKKTGEGYKCPKCGKMTFFHEYNTATENWYKCSSCGFRARRHGERIKEAEK